MSEQAVQRDMQDYTDKHLERQILVGYSVVDVPEVLEGPAKYMECEIFNSEKGEQIIRIHSDFVALKSSSWCGNTTYNVNGYDVFSGLRNYSLPAFFSGIGCSNDQPRNFSEFQALYGALIPQAMSGAFISEFYDLVLVNDSDTITLSADYVNLQGQLSKLDRKRLELSHANPTDVQHPDCIANLNFIGGSSPSFDLSERADGIDDLIKNGARGGVHVGMLVAMPSQYELTQKVHDSNGNQITGIKFTNPNNSGISNTPVESESSNDEPEDAAMSVRVSSAGLFGVMIAMVVFLVL